MRTLLLTPIVDSRYGTGRIESRIGLRSGAVSLLAGDNVFTRVQTEHKTLAELYSQIDDSNFSHEVLAARPEDLMVMRVGDVGWSDLGEPNRVLSTLARIGVESELAMSAS